MKRIVYFLIFMFLGWNLEAQNYDEKIALDSGRLEAKLGKIDLKLKVVFKNENAVRLTYPELVLLKKNRYPDGENYKFDTTKLDATRKLVTVNFDAKKLKIKCLVFNNVPIKVEFTLPSYDPNDKPYIPLKLLKTAGKPTLKGDILEVNMIAKENYDCISNSDNTTTTTTTTGDDSGKTNKYVNLSNSKEVRLIPCSYGSDVTQLKSELQTDLIDNFVFDVTEETNIPPPAKVVDDIPFGVTIRYFDNADKSKAEELKQLLNSYGKTVYLENMFPRYQPNGIPNYLEVWIK